MKKVLHDISKGLIILAQFFLILIVPFFILIAPIALSNETQNVNYLYLYTLHIVGYLYIVGRNL